MQNHPSPNEPAEEYLPDPALSQLDAVWEVEWHKHLFEAAVEKVKSKVSAKQYLIFDLSVVKEAPVSHEAGCFYYVMEMANPAQGEEAQQASSGPPMVAHNARPASACEPMTLSPGGHRPGRLPGRRA